MSASPSWLSVSVRVSKASEMQRLLAEANVLRFNAVEFEQQYGVTSTSQRLHYEADDRMHQMHELAQVGK
jgi:hypothetical protein